MNRVIMAHGNGAGSENEAAGGNGHSYWFPSIKSALEEGGIECITPDFPDPAKARASIWLPFIEQVLKAGEDDILVGHSSGALAAMRYAETHQLGGLVVVSAYHTDLGYESERETGYFDTPWDWEAMKANTGIKGQFASTDDPWIPIAEPRLIHEAVGTDYHEFTDQGHFIGSADQQKTQFPELLAYLQEKIS